MKTICFYHRNLSFAILQSSLSHAQVTLLHLPISTSYTLFTLSTEDYDWHSVESCTFLIPSIKSFFFLCQPITR